MIFLDKESIVRTPQRDIAIHSVKGGYRVLTDKGWESVQSVKYNSDVKLRTYRIETYAKTIEITCSDKMLVHTEEGWKRIKDLKKGVAIWMLGVFVPKKRSVIKSVAISHERIVQRGYMLLLQSEENEFFVNEINVKQLR